MVKKLDVTLLRYITQEHFRVVTAVEMGMKNHEIVPNDIICSISNLKHGGVHKLIKDLIRWRLLATERKGIVSGFRLTVMGYDYLALKGKLCFTYGFSPLTDVFPLKLCRQRASFTVLEI